MTDHIADEVVRIHEAAERVLAGESVWSICADWNAQGVPTVTGLVDRADPYLDPDLADGSPDCESTRAWS